MKEPKFKSGDTVMINTEGFSYISVLVKLPKKVYTKVINDEIFYTFVTKEIAIKDINEKQIFKTTRL